MPIVDDLTSIRQVWISKVSQRLARGESLRDSFRGELALFYDRLIQSVESGDPAWLDPIVAEWVQARTVTELEDQEPSLSPVFNQLLVITFEVVDEYLDNQAGLNLIGALLPAYTHMFDYAASLETNLRIEHISHELEKAREILERLDKSKSDFIAIAAHELKTPLTLIEGYASMLLEQIKRDPQQGVIMIKGINNGTRRLREIIDDMIDVSLIDNNLLSLNFQPVWINRLLDVIKEEVQDTVAARNQNLSIHLFPGSDDMFFGDGERLYQALKNVILNAIKYTPDGGDILVDGRKLPGFLEIIVEDTGIGIDPAYHSRIFEKFGRLGSASLHSSGKTKFKGGGPGLGLPITKGIVEAHGGAIWVDSDGYDEIRCPGTTFHILLPVRKEPPDEKIARLFSGRSEADIEEDILIDNFHALNKGS